MARAINYSQRAKLKPGKKIKPKDPVIRLSYLVAEQLLIDVGRPSDLLRVEARPVDTRTLRINLVREIKGVTSRADSYYVTYDDDAKILSSNPPLVRKYDS